MEKLWYFISLKVKSFYENNVADVIGPVMRSRFALFSISKAFSFSRFMDFTLACALNLTRKTSALFEDSTIMHYEKFFRRRKILDLERTQ